MRILPAMLAADFALPQGYSLGLAKAAHADAEWFEANPHRKHHVRECVEDAYKGLFDYVIVRRDNDGFRIVPVPADFRISDEEDKAAVLYIMAHYAAAEWLATDEDISIHLHEFLAALAWRMAARRKI
jgi:hypothetical protein